MRILQVCQRPQRRGAEVFAAQLSASLRLQGHEVRLAYLYPYSGEGLLPLDPEDRILDGDEDHPLETLIGYHPLLLRRLRNLMQSFRPDITQVNGARTVKYGVLARWQDADAAGAVVYRNIGTHEDWVKGFRRKVFYRAILPRVNGVVAISHRSEEALRQAFSHRTPQTVISNAIDPESLRPLVSRERLRASVGTPSSTPVVVYIGSLTPEKRIDRLIDAIRAVRAGGQQIALWIVGEGPLRGELEYRVERAALGADVIFLGPRNDVASYLAASDLLALTSDTEGVPAVVLEAGCLGLPVVATRVGGVPECIEDEGTGLLVDPDDRAALAGALNRLARDASFRAQLGDRARDRILEHHSVETIAREYTEFYVSVLASLKNSPAKPQAAKAVRRNGQPFLSEEMRLLLVLARPELEPRLVSWVREILTRDLDWDMLSNLARRHGLAPLLAKHLRHHNQYLPPGVTQALSDAQFDNAWRTLERTGQLLEILTALDEQGIVAVPYKGPALAAQLYGSGGLRSVGDLDIVVRPRDVARARTVLLALGYSARFPLGGDAVQFMVRYRYAEQFVREDGGFVELHWAFANRELPFAIDLEQLFSRLQSVDLGGHSVPAFRNEDLLLILSVHGAKHRWQRLEWVAGIAQLVRHMDQSDWDGLLGRAAALGVRRTLLLGLFLSASLCDAPVPPAVLVHVSEDPEVELLAEHVVRLLGSDPAGWELPDRLERDRFRIGLCERRWDRLRFVWYRATIPSDPDRWALIRVGGWHVPLHAFRRPFHVMGQLMIALRASIPSSA